MQNYNEVCQTVLEVKIVYVGENRAFPCKLMSIFVSCSVVLGATLQIEDFCELNRILSIDVLVKNEWKVLREA